MVSGSYLPRSLLDHTPNDRRSALSTRFDRVGSNEPTQRVRFNPHEAGTQMSQKDRRNLWMDLEIRKSARDVIFLFESAEGAAVFAGFKSCVSNVAVMFLE